MSTRLLIVSLLTLCSVVVSGTVQAPPAKAVSTATGVFTSAQASRGEQTYMSICVSCHPKGTYTAPAFREKWNGSPLSELYGFVSTSMPKLEPGSLEPEEYSAGDRLPAQTERRAGGQVGALDGRQGPATHPHLVSGEQMTIEH